MEIFWVKIHKLKYKTLLDDLKKQLEEKSTKQNIVFTPNPEIVLKAKEDKGFLDILNKATYSIPDWIWLYIWYSILENKKSPIIELLSLPFYIFNVVFRKRYLYKKYGERIQWSFLTKDLLIHCEEKNIKVSIIDLYSPNDEIKIESQKNFRKNLLKKFPSLKFDYFVYDKKEEVIDKIKKSDSKIVFSTLWMKKQEESIVEIMEECKNIKIGLWVWSSFDYFIGFQKKAPKFWSDIGFEWFYRLIVWRNKLKRIKRIYRATFIFILELLKEN